MRIFAFDRHHIKHPWTDAPPWALELRIMLGQILEKENKLMSAIDDLATAVAAEDTVIAGAVTLLNGIPALIASAGTDPAKLASLQSDIKAQTATLAAAVLAGTPTPAPAATPVAPAAAATVAAAAVAAGS